MATAAEYTVQLRRPPYSLAAFDKLMAPLVASWPVDADELFLLAPKTQPPLTAAKVLAWTVERGTPLLLYRDAQTQPLGYVELNPMPAERRHFWMGHCLIDPAQRGRGLGLLLVDMVLEHAFHNHGAGRVSLAVFPENEAAICCYRRAGFVDAGEQVKYFPTSGRQHRMLRMSIDAHRYHQSDSPAITPRVRPRTSG
jgi:RimJ/RimL family protein N-acetyltransferase